jgi:photosystem II stability/assembly factor-like uncharacterized protein
LGISFIDANTGWVCGARNGPIDISASTNGGSSYASQSNSTIFGWTYKIDAVSAKDIWTVGGAFFPTVSGLIINSSDGGSTWNAQNLGTIPFTYDVEAVNSKVIYACGELGFITGTTNGGNTWSTHTTGTSNGLWRISFADTISGLACGDNGTIIGTTDGGKNWTGESSGDSTRLNGIFMLDGVTAWAVGDGGVVLKRQLSVGIESLPKLKVSFYPNPVKNSARVVLDNVDMNTESNFILYNSFGQKVFQANFKTRIFMFDTNHLSPGIYHYFVSNKSASQSMGKIVIQ